MRPVIAEVVDVPDPVAGERGDGSQLRRARAAVAELAASVAVITEWSLEDPQMVV